MRENQSEMPVMLQRGKKREREKERNAAKA